MSTLNHIEQIEKYLAGALQGSELTEFELKLRENSELAGDLKAFKALMKGLHRHGLKQQLAGYETEIRKEQKGFLKVFRAKRILRIAAIFILAAGTSTFLYETFRNTHPDSKEIYSEYFTPYKNLSGVRGNYELLYVKGMAAYSEGEYAQALNYFEKISKEDSVYKDALFYGSICHLALKESDKSIEMLQELKANDGVYAQQTNWYTALAYLQSQRIKETKIQLKKIKPGEFKYEESRELLSKLK